MKGKKKIWLPVILFVSFMVFGGTVFGASDSMGKTVAAYQDTEKSDKTLSPAVGKAFKSATVEGPVAIMKVTETNIEWTRNADYENNKFALTITGIP